MTPHARNGNLETEGTGPIDYGIIAPRPSGAVFRHEVQSSAPSLLHICTVALCAASIANLSPLLVDTVTRAATLDGLALLQSRSRCCDFCCFSQDNARIHRIFRWFRPLTRLEEAGT